MICNNLSMTSNLLVKTSGIKQNNEFFKIKKLKK